MYTIITHRLVAQFSDTLYAVPRSMVIGVLIVALVYFASIICVEVYIPLKYRYKLADQDTEEGYGVLVDIDPLIQFLEKTGLDIGLFSFGEIFFSIMFLRLFVRRLLKVHIDLKVSHLKYSASSKKIVMMKDIESSRQSRHSRHSRQSRQSRNERSKQSRSIQPKHTQMEERADGAQRGDGNRHTRLVTLTTNTGTQTQAEKQVKKQDDPKSININTNVHSNNIGSGTIERSKTKSKTESRSKRNGRHSTMDVSRSTNGVAKDQVPLQIATKSTNLVLLSVISIIAVFISYMLFSWDHKSNNNKSYNNKISIYDYFLVLDTIICCISVYLNYSFASSVYDVFCYCHIFMDYIYLGCFFDLCCLCQSPFIPHKTSDKNMQNMQYSGDDQERETKINININYKIGSRHGPHASRDSRLSPTKIASFRSSNSGIASKVSVTSVVLASSNASIHIRELEYSKYVQDRAISHHVTFNHTTKNSSIDIDNLNTNKKHMIGPWCIEDERQSFLGKGAFSRVYKAIDHNFIHKNKNNSVFVAIKIIDNSDKIKTTQSKDAIRWMANNEIECLTKLSHPNIIKMISYDLKATFNDESVIAFVLEYAPNGGLRHLVDQMGGIPDNIANAYFHQIISAVNACHVTGIVHRDLKLDNIVLDSQYKAKICDFGLAKVKNFL